MFAQMNVNMYAQNSWFMNICIYLDRDKVVGPFLVDLYKTFDCISHGILIPKMKTCKHVFY